MRGRTLSTAFKSSTPHIGALAFGLVLLSGCAGAVRTATPADATWASQYWPETTETSLNEGRSLYVSKCASCHTLPLPSQMVRENFPTVLYRMARLAHMDEAETELAERYVRTITQTP